MSFSINNNGYTSQTNAITNTTNTTQTNTTQTATPNVGYKSDSVQLTSTPYAPTPDSAGSWKKISNSVGEMFSNIADKMGFGETRKLIKQEFNQVDLTKNQALDLREFNLATGNFLDFFGTEMAKADKDRSGLVDEKEYFNYRKEQLSNMFDYKDRTGDHHLNTTEVGFIGRTLLEKKDPRIDENQDGLLNKREFTRSVVKGSMSVRDLLGL